MKKVFIALAILACSVNIALSEQPVERDANFLKELSAKQKEYSGLWRYLNDKEKEAADDLNEEINLFNEAPSSAALQKIDNLKMEIMGVLQDQIINDRSYISYLEHNLSRLLGGEFAELVYTGDENNQSLPQTIQLRLKETPVKE